MVWIKNITKLKHRHYNVFNNITNHRATFQQSYRLFSVVAATAATTCPIKSQKQIIKDKSANDSTNNGGQNHCYNPLLNYQSHSIGNEKEILICGDGDLSFGASMAKGLLIKNGSGTGTSTSISAATSSHGSDDDVQLIVSVLESENEHNRVYRNSKKNIEIIRSCGHEVIFDLDATKLHRYFNDTQMVSFDRIQFNFPHWRGKQNNKRNRHLIQQFMASANKVITPGGQIHMGLLQHQGGMNATNKTEWLQSWMPGLYAAEESLLLTHALQYEPSYNLSSYQWKDRPFLLHGIAQMFIFTKPDGQIIAPKECQLFTFFSLFIALPQQENNLNGDLMLWSKDQILNEEFMNDIIDFHSPEGIRVEATCRRVLLDDVKNKTLLNSSRKQQRLVAEYIVYMYGEKQPITSTIAGKFKICIEEVVQKMSLGTRKGGWCVSKVMPVNIALNRK
mmetsp:Transcript_3040/g.3528  ORF Transcript_3040/g.3528 Transcript_3040/m.3528 type:complete len:449 (+) Transcript_3040:72-1418(+)